MKTWRNIFILVTLVSLAACSKVENVYVPEAISYSVGSYANATKATPMNGENGQNGDNITAFRSKAWLHAGDNPGVSQLFFDESVVYDGTSEWAPAHVYYWPKHPQSYLNFVSWYDALGAPTSVDESSISWENRTIQAGDNILLAQKAWKQRNNTLTYYRSGVPTLFRHLLAQVEFKAQALAASETVGSVTTTWNIAISNFTVSGVHNEGSITLTNDTEPTVQSGSPVISEWAITTSGTTTSGWSASSATVSLSGTDQVLTTSPVPVLARRSVLPQPVSGISVSFDYSIITTSTNGTDTHVLTETQTVSDLQLSSFTGYTGDWEANKRVTYTITVNGKTGAISIVPTLTTTDSTLILNVE